LHAAGDVASALELHRQALAGSARIRYKYGEARALDGIAACLRDADPAAARQHWQRALRLLQELDHPDRHEVERQLAAHSDQPSIDHELWHPEWRRSCS
jgi:hypothetical protein